MSNRRTQRKAYFQGAGDASVEGNITSNDPTKLGYGSKDGIQYDRKPMETTAPGGQDTRPYEDKAFNDAANRTKKDLGPSGAEFDLKKHWLRIPEDAKIANAKMTAGLTRNADVKNSYWTLYTVGSKGEKTPVLKATFAELWGNKLSKKVANELGLPQHADKEIWTNEEVAKDVVAKTTSKGYIDNVFKSIRNDGFSFVGYLMTGHEGFLKRAQASGKIAKAQYAQEGIDTPAAPAMEAAPAGEMAPAGDDMGAALDAEVENTASEADVTVDLLMQKHEELEGAQTNLVEKTAPETTADVFVQLQDAEKMVDEAKEEMALASRMLRSKNITAAQKIKFIKLTAEAQEEAIDALSGGDNVLDKAKQAVESADAAIQQANEVAGGEAGAAEGAPAGGEEMMHEEPMAAEHGEAPVATETLDIEASLKGGKAKDFVAKFLQSRAEMRKKANEVGADQSYEQGKYGVHPDGSPKDGDGEINAAHPDGGHTLTNVEVGGKPGDNGARFDTVIEQHKHNVGVAEKTPSGELSNKQLAVAAVEGKVTTASEGHPDIADSDQAAKEFWGKDLWGQSDAKGKEFGKLLYKDFQSKASAVASEAQAKVVRAYELADEAIEKGFCDRTAEAKSKFVKEVVAFNDESFISFKNLVDAAPKKSDARVAIASANISTKKIPNVGLKDDSGEVSDDLVSRLSSLNWK